MRVARNTDGERKFQRSERLSKSRLQGFFSRLTASKRRMNKQELEADDDHDDSLDKDEVAYLAEKKRHGSRGGCQQNWTCSSYNT